jgi:hypothetical protein
LDGRVLGHATVSSDESFAMQLVLEGDARGRGLAVFVESDEGEVRRFEVTIPDRTQAEIDYPPGSTPLIVSDSELVFEGSLARVPTTEDAIRSVTYVSLESGLVQEVLPTPALGVPFRVSLPASRHACGTVLSWHGRNRWGGCWWPSGGTGGCSGGCTQQEYQTGLCSASSCTRAEYESGFCGPSGTPCVEDRGCTVIEADEPPRPPPPVREDVIPTEPPAAIPLDAAVSVDAAGDVILR